ncbi:MAG: hypothetical protein WBX77_08350, partial [Pseudolabrys sp.]
MIDNVRPPTPAVGEGPSVHCHRPLARWSRRPAQTLTFKDAGGVIREVDFSLISVERDGRPEEYSTTASAASS